MNGIERFIKRREVVTDSKRNFTLELSNGNCYLIEDLISKMADELCDLLEWRDRIEGKIDNPPSIDDCIPNLTGLKKELGRE